MNYINTCAEHTSCLPADLHESPLVLFASKEVNKTYGQVVENYTRVATSKNVHTLLVGGS